MTQATKPETVARVLAEAVRRPPENQTDYPTGDIARVVGVSQRTVENLLGRYVPVAEGLKTFQRDHFIGSWQFTYLRAFQHLTELADLTPSTLAERKQIGSAMKDYAVVMGISTERLLDLLGEPTRPVAVMHEHRLTLGAVAERLLRIGNPSAARPYDRKLSRAQAELAAPEPSSA